MFFSFLGYSPSYITDQITDNNLITLRSGKEWRKQPVTLQIGTARLIYALVTAVVQAEQHFLAWW